MSMGGEVRELLVPNSNLQGGVDNRWKRQRSESVQEEQSTYLSPLQEGLLYELTTRRARLAAAQSQADFWLKRQGEEVKDRFQADVLDEDFFQRLIDSRKEQLVRLREAKQLKEAVVQAADAAHAVGSSMAACPPDQSLQVPLSRLPLRTMATRRDQVALDFLRIDAELKQIANQRREMTRNIDATRAQTSLLIQEVRVQGQEAEQRRHESRSSSSAWNEKSRKLDGELQAARGKREMVKGVLRGIIMESGLDWYGDRELRSLVLDLGDDDLDASDDEPDFGSDEGEEDEGLEDGEG